MSDWRTDLGGEKNFHNGPGGNCDCIALMAYYVVCKDVTSLQEIEEMEGNLFLPSFRKLSKLKFIDINKPLCKKLLHRAFLNAKKQCDKWGDFEMHVAPFDKDQPIYYEFTACPTAEFAKKHDLLEVMPALCNPDFAGMELIHARLIRKTTCSNGCKCDYTICGEVTALIDGSEGVVVVAQTLGVRLGAGGVAELHVGEVLRGLDHVVFVTERVGEDDVAAGVGELSGLVVALLTFGNVGHDGVLDAERLAGLFRSVDEVEVVGGVFVVEHDEADLEIGDFVVVLIVGVGIVLLIAAGDKGENHHETQEQCKELLHFGKSSLNFTAIKRFEYRYHHDT